MHPAVLAIAMAAAEGFGRSIGEGLGRSLFGSGDRKTGRELAEISRQLDEALRRLTYLTGLVVELPDVVLQIEIENTLFEAEIRLEAVLDYINAQPEGAVLPEGTEHDFLFIIPNWKTIVVLENRPTKLMELPMRTEIVRARLGANYDSLLVELLKIKQTVIDAEIEELKASLNEDILLATQILQTDTFRSNEILPEAPYLKWTAAPDRPESEIVRYREWDSVQPIRANILWNKRKRQRIHKLKEIQAEITEGAANLSAAVPVSELLQRYMPTLNANGSLPGNFNSRRFLGSCVNQLV